MNFKIIKKLRPKSNLVIAGDFNVRTVTEALEIKQKNRLYKNKPHKYSLQAQTMSTIKMGIANENNRKKSKDKKMSIPKSNWQHSCEGKP